MTNVAFAQNESDVAANDNNGVRVDPDLRALIPPLAPDEYAGLEESLVSEGCRDPIITWNNTIVDGHNRYEICTRRAITYRIAAREFESRAHAKIWMRKNQLSRRNLADTWKIDLELGNKADLEEIGRAKQLTTLKQNAVLSKNDNTEPDYVPDFLKIGGVASTDEPTQAPRKHNTRDIIAKAAGVSTGKVAQAEYVKKKAPDLWEKAKADGLTVGNVYAEVKKAEKKEARDQLIKDQKEAIESGAVVLPAGVFEVVAMDPPWNYGREYDPDTSRVANPYPEMTQEQLLAMEPPFAEDCVLFLWTTHQFIWDAKALMDNWGFAYKANLVWDKDRMGMGAWVRMQCEFCLVGIKGKPHWNNTKWRDIIREQRREHSRKPEVFYQMVEEITAGRRLDFFSREARNGWESFGNDKDKF